jgi:hypothetical protein
MGAPGGEPMSEIDERRRDALLRLDTHWNRYKRLLSEEMRVTKALRDEVLKVAPYLTPEYKAGFIEIFESCKAVFEDIAETIQLIADDMQDFGEASLIAMEEMRKRLEEIERQIDEHED